MGSCTDSATTLFGPVSRLIGDPDDHDRDAEFVGLFNYFRKSIFVLSRYSVLRDKPLEQPSALWILQCPMEVESCFQTVITAYFSSVVAELTDEMHAADTPHAASGMISSEGRSTCG
jgi:hypothetical protein